jgi:hypothetical protein
VSLPDIRSTWVDYADKTASSELLYHAVVILSCRSKPTLSGKVTTDVRETLAARSIITIIGTEYPDQITHTPVAPYALSLSLRVLYREMRFSATSPFTRNRLRTQLLSACQLLRASFSAAFPHAMRLAQLAEHTVSQMDKAYDHILHRSDVAQGGYRSVEQSRLPESAPAPAAIQPEIQSSPNEHLAGEIDPVVFDGMPNVDIFEFFDPDFRLDIVDAALVENMALAISPTFTTDSS